MKALIFGAVQRGLCHGVLAESPVRTASCAVWIIFHLGRYECESGAKKNNHPTPHRPEGSVAWLGSDVRKGSVAWLGSGRGKRSAHFSHMPPALAAFCCVLLRAC